jgi:hypothetical protein
MILWSSFIVFLWVLTSCEAVAVRQTNNERMPRLTPELISLYDQYSAYLASERRGPFKPANPIIPVVDDRVVVDAVPSGDVNALKADLEALGIRQAVVFGRVISGQLPISSIPAMAKLPTLNFARPATALTRKSEAPASLRQR